MSPITVGVLLVAVLLMGAELALFRRPRRHPASAGAPVASQAAPAIAPAPAPQPPATVAPAPAAPPPIVATPAAAPAPVVDRAVVAQRRALLGAVQNQRLIQQVDEALFTTEKIDEPTRAAIRRINEDHARRLQALVDSNAALGEAERSRRMALDALLGPEAARAFDMAEHMAARRVRPRYRRAWAEELRQQAPLP